MPLDRRCACAPRSRITRQPCRFQGAGFAALSGFSKLSRSPSSPAVAAVITPRPTARQPAFNMSAAICIAQVEGHVQKNVQQPAGCCHEGPRDSSLHGAAMPGALIEHSGFPVRLAYQSFECCLMKCLSSWPRGECLSSASHTERRYLEPPQSSQTSSSS